MGQVEDAYTAYDARERARMVADQASLVASQAMAVLPARFRDAGWEDFARPELWGRTAIAEGSNVFMHGKTGVGKTHAAAAAAAAFIGQQYVVTVDSYHRSNPLPAPLVAWINTSEWLYLMRESFDGASKLQSLERIAAAPFIVIDDIGGEHVTPWAIETLEVVVNKLYQAKGQLFITSNLDAAELAKKLGPRIAGRLIEDAVQIHATGQNVRIQRSKREGGA